MADRRVKIAKDKAYLVEALGEDKNGPFETYADVMVFAASLGTRRKKIVPLKEIAKKPEPIKQSVFANRGYEPVINLLAISHTKDTKILAFDEESENERIRIFEEYANGGLEILEDQLRGSVNYLEQILLLLISERNNSQTPNGEFDLSEFLSI
ncbi:DNA phosphorothioation-associated protein 4 [Nostoc sp. CENA67]|uniref:DNA phosphorothioation-associated protein 4 n=1 Tax=Amazonocrinis nigriterrae CENA67 TaxID=2794033 RepID=A0A8J7L9S6_9NOST|nr:DNA phosphorothioation-associated protein 4 [Amazonocrinis nigriterrae]MBH8564430.1 DNA phosphorothioation-associated protein 4 [Amazonocrinis nigriterrae CENA67]